MRERDLSNHTSQFSLAKTRKKRETSKIIRISTIRERREEVISTAKDEYISTVRI